MRSREILEDYAGGSERDFNVQSAAVLPVEDVGHVTREYLEVVAVPDRSLEQHTYGVRQLGYGG